MVSWIKNLLTRNWLIQNTIKTYQQNGGIKGCYDILLRTDDLKFGKFVGLDQFGNRYFENPYYFFGTNRWVIYTEKVGLNYDASMIPAEWYGWLHYKTDYTPCQDPGRPVYKWMAPHSDNLSWTNKHFVPYSTTRPKIQAWQPVGLEPRPPPHRTPPDPCQED